MVKKFINLRKMFLAGLVKVIWLLNVGCGLMQSSPAPDIHKVVDTQHGKASWYSVRTNGGTATKSGRRLRDHEFTAAHKHLPMGTKVRVINLANNKSAIVTITDVGPFIAGRVIDVTIGVAKELDFIKRGVVPVKLEILEKT